jgi:1,4-dihydroxy-2-naphthoate octaprenyltransferase
LTSEVVGTAGSRAKGVLRLTRAPFLLGGVVFNALGVSFAMVAGQPFDWEAAVLSQVVITCAQLMVHFANDYYDLEADALNEAASRWSGGSRALVEGEVPASWAIRASRVAGGVSVAASALLVLVIQPEPALAVLTAPALCLAWAYSAPPLRLVASGMGELAGAVLLAGLTPMIAYAAQGAHGFFGVAVVLTPLVALQYAMLITVSLPDMDGDREAGKRTLAVRRGARSSGLSAIVALTGAYVVAALLSIMGSPLLTLAYGVWAPVAAYQARMLQTGGGRDPARWNRAGFWAIGLVIGSALTLTAVLLATA